MTANDAVKRSLGQRLRQAARPLARMVVRIGLPAALLSCVIWGPDLVWILAPTHDVRVRIVDKTVPPEDYRHHESLTWLLHALKIRSPSEPFAVASRDYVGFDPSTKRGTDLRSSDLADRDVLFIADTYGVYTGDYATAGSARNTNARKRLYGGLSDAEAETIDRFAARGGRVIAEFNTFAEPTIPSARQRLEHVFGVRWTHWVGRYFDELGDAADVPPWVREVYEKVNRVPYGATGPGFVFVHDDDDLFILQPGGQLEHDLISLQRLRESYELRGLPMQTVFLGWMDVLEAVACDVLYEHVLLVTDDGRTILQEHHFPSHFPAITRRRGHSAYYLAGDMADTAMEFDDPERAGIFFYNRLMLRDEQSTPSERFFWRFYAPLIEALLVPRYR